MRALIKKIRQLLKDRRFRKIWYRSISATAAVVVFITTYALVLPAITMETEAKCGIPAHQHTTECYEEQLICGQEESDGHHHTDECYTVTKELTCEIPEHKHDESCFDEDGNLTCSQDEHSHSDTCYEEHRELTCGLEESDGHHHDSSCYKQVLTCGLEAHIHSTECYKEDSKAVTASTSTPASEDSGTAVATTAASTAVPVKMDDPEKSFDVSDTDSTSSDTFSDTSDISPDAADTSDKSDITASNDTVDTSGADSVEEMTDNENAEQTSAFDEASLESPVSDSDDSNAESENSSIAATTDVLPEPIEQEKLSEGYVPTLDPVNMDQVLDRQTGFYYYHAEEGEDLPASSAEITSWKKVEDNTELAPADLVKAYFAYTIPAGTLNETNQVARYHLPSNLHLTDDQIIAINQTVNGVAAAYLDQDTFQITDTDNYNKYLGVEAVEGTRTPDENPQEGTQEYISAVVKAENVFDTEGIYGEKGAYLGQDIIFIFTPYSIEKNQHEYDADGTPVKAGEKIKGWFTLDFNMEQVDWTENFTEDGEEGQIVEKTADIIFASEDKSAGTKEIGETLTLVEETANEFDEDVDFDTDADAVDIDTTFTEDTSAALTEDTAADSTENAAEASTEDVAATDTAATASTEDAAKASTEEQSTTATSDKEYKDGTLTASGDGYKITLDYTAEAQIPEKASLQVREITAETDKEAYEECLEQAKQSVGADQDDNTTVEETATRFFDIEIAVTDEKGDLHKIEPKAAVNVNIQLDAVTPAAGTEKDTQPELSDPTVLHFAEEGVETLENVDTSDRGKDTSTEIQFEASSFSIYGVVYTSTITKRILTSNGETYDISVLYEENAQIPANADLNVREITPDTAEYQDYLRQSADHLDAESIRDISYARFFDIEIVDENGNKIEPAAPVLVNIEYVDGAEIEAAKDLHVVHFADDGTEVLEGIGVNQDGTVMTYLQDGFSVTGTVVTNPAANDQYMVLIEYQPGSGNYYIVNNDGTLTKVDTNSDGTVEVDEPMMWTYDGKNIYHHSEQTSFNSGQVAADFYNKYIDPTDTADGISKDQDNSGTRLRNVNEQYWDMSTWQMRTSTYQVIQNRPQTDVAAVTLSGNKIQSRSNPGKYLGVVEEDGVLKLVGGVSAENAATVRLATANEVLKTNYLNHVVNHIDISIEGEAEADIPLAYGKYYDANGNVIKEVVNGADETLHLNSGVVGIGMDDMKRAIITAYTKDSNGKTTEIDDAFVVTGYSANESTAYSTQQVRIEGDFRVANIPPVTQQYYNQHKGEVWQNRLNNRIYYNVTAFKTVEFDLVDPEVGQLYDEFGNKMTVKVDVALSASFDYWDQRNECPPLRWDGDWLGGKGTIPDHNLSGMDFVLGGNPEGNAKVRAIEIKKIIVDENGNRISPKTPITQTFNIYYNEDGSKNNANNAWKNGSALRNSDQIKDLGSPAYGSYDATDPANGFVYQHKKMLRVGEDGIGQIYDYDVDEGVFYITENKEDVEKTITDTSNKTWYYNSTYIETEYANRSGQYDRYLGVDSVTGEPKYAETGGVKNSHRSQTYTDLDGEQAYSSRAEILGRHLYYDGNDTGHKGENDNEFLEFTVYNVYRSSLVDTETLDVTKAWTPGQEDETVQEVYIKIYRKAGNNEAEDFTSQIQSEIQADEKNAYLYFDNSERFSRENGWIIVKKTGSGAGAAWETVSVKNLPTKTSADNDAQKYTYYIREVGYKDQDGNVYSNADSFDPQYTYSSSAPEGSGSSAAVPANSFSSVSENGIELGDNNHFKVTNTKVSTKTNFKVIKTFDGGYPTDGSVQVLVGLEQNYKMQGETSFAGEWKDADTATPAVIALPNPKPTSGTDSEMTDEEWYASPDAWTATWTGLNAVQKIDSNTTVPLYYRAKEIAAYWFGTPVRTDSNGDNGQEVVPLTTELDNSTTVNAQSSTIQNQPTTDELTVNKEWAVDGETGEWPDGAKAEVQVVQYWHLAKVDNTDSMPAITVGNAFHAEDMSGSDYKATLSKGGSNESHTFTGLPSYAYKTIANDTTDDSLIVEARKAGVTLEKGRKYLVVYTYGARETSFTLNGIEIPMDLTVPGEQGDGDKINTFTSNIKNEVTDLTVKKEWKKDGKTISWPAEIDKIDYKIMQVEVYTREDGRTVELETKTYLQKDDAGYQALTSANPSADYRNLPVNGAKTLSSDNSFGLPAGTYPTTFRYYAVEEATGSADENGFSTTEITASPVNGVATLTNEYTEIKVEKKWKKNGTPMDEFPEGYVVNWKVVQTASDGSEVNPYYLASDYNTVLEKSTRESYELKYLPASGVKDGKPVTYTYEVYEVAENSTSTNALYTFQDTKAVPGIGADGITKYIITNELTDVEVHKTWIGTEGTKVVVQLYRSYEEPEKVQTTDVTVVLDNWMPAGTSIAQSQGTVTGILEGPDGTEREFTLTPNAQGQWVYTFAGLPKNDSNNQPITYKVKAGSLRSTSSPALTGLDIVTTEGATEANNYTIHLKADGRTNRDAAVTITWESDVPQNASVKVTIDNDNTKTATLTRSNASGAETSTAQITGLSFGTHTVTYEWTNSEGKAETLTTSIAAGNDDVEITATGIKKSGGSNGKDYATIKMDATRVTASDFNIRIDNNNNFYYKKSGDSFVQIGDQNTHWTNDTINVSNSIKTREVNADKKKTEGEVYFAFKITNEKGTNPLYIRTDPAYIMHDGYYLVRANQDEIKIEFSSTSFAKLNVFPGSGTTLAEGMSSTPSMRSLIPSSRTPAVMNQSSSATETIEAPVVTGTEAQELIVVSEGNLPEGAKPVGGTVDLLPTDWYHKWENLPKVDGEGRRIYYYVVEKQAFSTAEGSASASYEISTDNEGNTHWEIKNDTDTNRKAGTLEVSKELSGIRENDTENQNKKFKFSLQNVATGKYLAPNPDETDVENPYIWHEAKYEQWEIDKNSKLIFTNLTVGNYVLKEAEGGLAIATYVLSEDSVTGTAESGIAVKADATSEFTFKNIYEPAMRSIRVKKAWQNADGSQTAPIGAQVKFQLFSKAGDETSPVGEPVTLNGEVDEHEPVSWTAEWKELPRYTAANQEITYSVEEVVDGSGFSWEHYKVSSSDQDGVTFRNTDTETKTITNEEHTTIIQVTKEWKDREGNEKAITEGTEIRFTLYQLYADENGNHTSVYTKAVDSNGTPLVDGKGTVKYTSGAWQTVQIKNLPDKVQGESGQWYTAKYYVEEEGHPKVTTSYVLDGSGSNQPEGTAARDDEKITIINSDDSTSLKVVKTWDELAANKSYTLDFKLQRLLLDDENAQWEDTPGAYKLEYNGSAFTITKTVDTTVTTYPSNTLQYLETGYQYRIVETGYSVPASAIETKDDLNIIGTSETTDNGRTWISTVHNTLEKIEKIEGKKIWKDAKSHTDPILILKRSDAAGASAWTDADWENAGKSWEVITAGTEDPTIYKAAPKDTDLEKSEDYTYLQPIWDNREDSTDHKTYRYYRYTSLPKYSPQGLEYIYRVFEKPVDGFNTEYGTASAGNFGRNITNIPVGSLQITKVWFAGAKESEKQTVTYRLECKAGDSEWGPISQYVLNNETGSWTPKLEASGTTHTLPRTVADETKENKWTATFANLPRLKESTTGGITMYEPIYYRVVEEKVNGTEVSYQVETGDQAYLIGTAGNEWDVTNDAPQDLDDDSTVELTMNNDKPMISISGKKTWVTTRPSTELPELTLQLTSWQVDENGIEVASTRKIWEKVTNAEYASSIEHKYVEVIDDATPDLTEDVTTPRFRWYKNDEMKVWNYAFTFLPKAENGKLLRYEVKEIMNTSTDAAAALASTFSQEVTPGTMTEKGDLINYDFTNTDKTDIYLDKTWIINEEIATNSDVKSLFPDLQLTFRLYRTGDEKVIQMGDVFVVKVNDAANPQTTWTAGIPAEDQVIKYSVADLDSDGDDSKDDGWKMTINDLPKSFRKPNGEVGTYSYYLIEESSGIFTPLYKVDGKYKKADSIGAQISAGAEDASGRTIEIQNSTYSVELPASGGPGTKLIYFLGSILTMAAGLLLLFDRKRNRG